MTEDDLTTNLVHGVTTLRVMWGEPSLLRMRERIRAGTMVGPRIYSAGRIIDGANPIQFGSVALANPADAPDVVARQREMGFDFIKAYSRLSVESFDALIAAAKAEGMPVIGHIPDTVSLDHALRSGMVSNSHLMIYVDKVRKDGIPLIDNISDPASVAQMEALGRGEITIDSLIDEEKLRAAIAQTAENSVAVVPTFEVYKIFTDIVQPRRPLEDSWHSLATRSYWDRIALLVPLSDDARRGRALVQQETYEIARRMAKAGVRLFAGTDAPLPYTYRGGGVIEEIKNFHRGVGLSTLEALRTATSEPGKFLDPSGELGVIREGARADAVLLAANPLDDLDALYQPEAVFIDGQPQSRADLVARMNAVSEGNEQLLTRFATAPDFGPGFDFIIGTLADYINPQGRALRVGIGRDGDKKVIHVAESEAPGEPWQTTLVTLSGEASSRIERDGKVIATSTDALILTGTMIDLYVVDAYLQDLEIGDARTLRFRTCDWSGACDPQPLAVTFERGIDSVRDDGHFYYTGHKVFDASPSAALPSQLWLGGGGYKGQVVGFLPSDFYHDNWRRVR